MRRQVLDSDGKVEFKTKYLSRVAGDIDHEYLAKTTVVGFYKGSEMVGGYILNVKPPFRYLSYIPVHQRSQFLHIESDTCEIACIWKDKSLTLIQSLFLYFQSIRDASFSKKSTILAGTANDQVRKIQQTIFSKNLWHGLSTQNCTQWVYYEQRNLLMWKFFSKGILIYPMIKILSRAKKFANRKSNFAWKFKPSKTLR